MKKDPLIPSPTLLIKLGSIAVHVEEYLSVFGDPLDKSAIDALLVDSEVKEWRKQMDAMAFLPVKRHND